MLALLQKENPAAEQMAELMRKAGQNEVQLAMSLINLGEVFYIFGRKNGAQAAEELLTTLQRLPIQILPAAEHSVFAAARYKMNNAISYADAFAVAAAKKRDAVLLTGDPELLSLTQEVQIEQLVR
jgi:predicted nucleic acid-binding protein